MHLVHRRPWWDGENLDRLLKDVVSAELARMRPGWDGRLARDGGDPALGTDGLGLDSLERLRVAEAVAEALDLRSMGEGAMGAPSTWADLEAEVLRLLPAGGETLGFRTSGSTGRPKTVHQRLADLHREVELLSRLVGPVRRILSLLPSHAIYGFLFTILLPRRLGVPVVDLRGRPYVSLSSRMEPGDLVVATPPVWTAVAEGPDRPGGVTGVSSGAPCPARTAATLRTGGLRMIEIYGSTETGGIGWRDDEREPFRLFPIWSRRDDDGLTDIGSDPHRQVDLPDLVAWDGPDLLRPIGRRDGAVQVAGVNVWPERTAAVLRAHPGVAEARVRLMRPDEGDWLKGFVVPRHACDPGVLRRELDGWCRERLSAPERPRAISFGPALPVTPAGKPGDWFLDEA